MSDQKTDVLNWDDTLEDTGYELIPEGFVSFEILDFQRTRKTKGKLGECNVAVLKLSVEHVDTGEKGTIEEELPLHKKLQFLLLQFFSSIGQRKPGDEGAFSPNWAKSAIVGATGMCEIGIRTFEKRDGSQGSANEIKKWLAPGEQPEGLQF